MTESLDRLSRKVARLLRHADGLPADGWVPVPMLRRQLSITTGDLERVLAHSTRFELDTHGQRVRARYGHSTEVTTTTPAEPPALLYHGTSWAVVGAILRDGLSPMERSRVHLVVSSERARERGEVVMVVDAAAAHEAGQRFWDTGTDVGLTEHVPARWVTRL